MGKGASGKKFERFVVIHVAVLDNPAMTVVCVLTQANVSYYHDVVAEELLYNANRLLNNPVFGIGTASNFIFLLRDTEKENGRNGGLQRLLSPAKSFNRELDTSGMAG